MNVDFDALDELFRMHDVLGLISIGCPDDEYTPEVERIYAQLDSLLTGEASVDKLISIFRSVYKHMFTLSDVELRKKYPQFEEIAEKVIAYWG